MNKKSLLVIFGKDFPSKPKKWYRQFDEIIGPKELQNFISPGSIQQAYALSNKLSRFILPDGSRLSKLVNLQGYELWWMHYESIHYKFCLPYTQYRKLLFYLKNFERVSLFQAPWPHLFQYFLRAHDRRCTIISQFRFRNLLPVPSGVFIQCLLSLGFLLWLKITRPALMVRTSDKFDPPYDFDYRQKFIYEELRKRKIPFVEFIRSLESSMTVLGHAWRRKRPVVYSTAIIGFINSFANCFGRYSPPFSNIDPEERFWFQVSTHYLRNIRGTIWSIRVMKFILQWIGVKAAITTAGCNRTFYEVLGCKLAGIKTVGIQHGAIPRYYFVSDFMPEFDGKKPLSLDKYGLWSNWWRDYYLKYSRAFKPEQLGVSGHMRPLERKNVEEAAPSTGPVKVLFISEQLADPKEVMPYLLALLLVKDFALSLKIRPQRDGFEDWLKKNEPGILERIKVLKGDIHQAISQSRVVVGSHSTSVLEGLAQLKPLVFFWTDRWGDYFDIRTFDFQGRFFAKDPQDLIDKIRKSIDVPKEDLIKLQEQFFGNPYQNGSKWVVDQAVEFLDE
ncbi:MAG: hypothetical protein A2896_01400 [Candidatus Nealsonbacteria bacterium RIFCSPLOWO2_01_FULL_43_32]|uniref:Uncharacterized protein n=1 Tax=Candidatus Nealsonbacteria bacterium RIFCSPLOWO2_01_FULL_43_32 TaxID=1801672 RepID=A0A1G2EDY1_9BACT|nr:MAG: hypothetical protein A2896_01400 [Candidatus Nealsonbacteria bacterium RIFCSPLOWO2_01_FULL_43_32]